MSFETFMRRPPRWDTTKHHDTSQKKTPLVTDPKMIEETTNSLKIVAIEVLEYVLIMFSLNYSHFYFYFYPSTLQLDGVLISRQNGQKAKHTYKILS